MKRLIFTLFILLGTTLQLSAEKIDYTRWMARLDDATPITQLSVPGTHDTGTGNGFTDEWKELGKTFGTTQDCSLEQQLASGIRAFDLRPAVASDGAHLNIFHGVMKTNLNYEDAIHTLIRFVTANSTEFAFVVMRHEDDGDNGSKEWGRIMEAFLNSPEVKSHIADYSPSLTVKDVRGKIIVLSRKRYADSPVGGYIEKWTSDEDINAQCSGKVWSQAGKGSLYVQDYYSTHGEQMDIKLKNLERMLDMAMNAMRRDLSPLASTHLPLIINHTSGYTEEKTIEGTNVSMATNAGYRDNAAHTNKCVINYLKKHKGPTGLIMMDFAGVNKSDKFKVRSLELTQAVVKQNFR